MSEAPRLSRRRVLGGAAVAGAGVLLAPTAAMAREPSGGRVFSHWLGELRGASPPITAARFVLAGVQWAAPDGARIELRARQRDGGWSRWAVASVQGHEPDRPTRPGQRFGEPLWFGPADELQVRTASGPVSGVRLHFVAAAAVAAELETLDPRGSHRAVAASLPLPLAAPVLPAGAGQPPIIARQAWAGRHDGPSAGPYYGSIRLAFVHHTENPNGYSAGEVPAMILAIYDYHRYSRGYFDIAYNFVIDAFGRTWEARAGGIDEPVIGAHAGGYNSESTGVALLGSFSFQSPTAAAMTALQRLLAWKLPLHGVPAHGKVQVQVSPADAFYTPFAPGQLVRLPRIAGHRDGDLTDCPGDDLYFRLPSVRSTVDRLAGPTPSLTLTASEMTVAPATPVTLTGRLTSGSPAAAIAQAPLAIQTVAGIGVVTTVAAATTADDGSFTATVTPSRSAVLRALHAAAPAIVSDLVVVGVTPVLTLVAASTSPLRVSGTVTPAKATVAISVYALSGGRRRLLLTEKATVHAGRFGARLTLPGRAQHGPLVIIARTAADVANAAGVSPPLRVTV